MKKEKVGGSFSLSFIDCLEKKIVEHAKIKCSMSSREFLWKSTHAKKHASILIA